MNTFIIPAKNNKKIIKESSIIKSIQAASMLVGLSVAIGSYDAEAKLPLNVFKGVTDSFNVKHKNFSPTLGMAALDSSIIYNLRFYGNFDYKNRNKPIEDVPQDAIAILVKELFPSNTGELGVGMTAPQWLSNNLESPFIIAKLLNFVNTLRENGGQVSKSERLKLIAEIKANWEKEYPEVERGRRQFQKDSATVLEKEPQNFADLRVALNKMVSLNVEKTTDLFKKKNNDTNDIKISIFNDIVDIRHSLGTREEIDTILNNTEMDNDLKISKIKEIIELNFNTEKYVNDEMSQIQVVNINPFKTAIEKDIQTVQDILERWIKPKNLRDEIVNKQTNFAKEIKNLLTQKEKEVDQILILNRTDDEKLTLIEWRLKHDANEEKYKKVETFMQKLKETMKPRILSTFKIDTITNNKNIKNSDIKKFLIQNNLQKLLRGEKSDKEKISDILNELRKNFLNEENIKKIISEEAILANQENINQSVIKIIDGYIEDICQTMRRISSLSSKKIFDTINRIYGNELLNTKTIVLTNLVEKFELSKEIDSILNKEYGDKYKKNQLIKIFYILKLSLEEQKNFAPFQEETERRVKLFQIDRSNVRSNKYQKFFGDSPVVREIEYTEQKVQTPSHNSTLNRILDSITESIQNELSTDSVYPKYTTEQIILAYFCEKFNTQEDLKQLLTMLSNMNQNIVAPNNIHLGLMTAEKLDNSILPENFDTVYYIQNADKFAENNPIPPYAKTSMLLSNNTTYAFDRTKIKITDKTFQDCAEIAIRHFMNLALYNPERRQFDLSTIKEYVKENNPNFQNFVAFYENDLNPLVQPLLKNNEIYKKQTPDRVENGSPATRSAWNIVMGDLNVGMIDANTNNIKYLKNESYEYEVKPGFINFILACQKVFGLKFDHGEFDPNKSPEDKLEWLEKSFKVLFNALTDQRNSKKFDADFTDVKFEDSDFYGAAKITAYQNNTKLFSFNLNESSIHAYISHLIRHKTTVEKQLLDINYGIEPQTAEEVLWLLSANKTNDKIKARATHPFYKLFDKELKENSQKIEFLGKVSDHYDPNNLFFSQPVFKAMLKNILSSLSLEDPQALQQAAPILMQLIELNIVGRDSMKTVNMGGNYVPIIQGLNDTAKAVMHVIRMAKESGNTTFIKDPLRDLIMYTSYYSSTKSNTKDLEIMLADLSLNKAEDFKIAAQYLMSLLNSNDPHLSKVLEQALLKVNMKGINFEGSNLGREKSAISLLCKMLELNNPTLITLDLSSNRIHDSDVQDLVRALKQNKILTTLNLHYNYIKEAGLQALINLRETNTTLKDLNIDENPYSDDQVVREDLLEKFREVWQSPDEELSLNRSAECCIQ